MRAAHDDEDGTGRPPRRCCFAPGAPAGAPARARAEWRTLFLKIGCAQADAGRAETLRLARDAFRAASVCAGVIATPFLLAPRARPRCGLRFAFWACVLERVFHPVFQTVLLRDGHDDDDGEDEGDTCRRRRRAWCGCVPSSARSSSSSSTRRRRGVLERARVSRVPPRACSERPLPPRIRRRRVFPSCLARAGAPLMRRSMLLLMAVDTDHVGHSRRRSQKTPGRLLRPHGA